MSFLKFVNRDFGDPWKLTCANLMAFDLGYPNLAGLAQKIAKIKRLLYYFINGSFNLDFYQSLMNTVENLYCAGCRVSI